MAFESFERIELVQFNIMPMRKIGMGLNLFSPVYLFVSENISLVLNLPSSTDQRRASQLVKAMYTKHW